MGEYMILDVIPVTRVELELTEQCNLRCKFCYNSCKPDTCEKPKRIIDAITASGALEIILTGGEPSLHPDFLSILNYAVERCPRVMVQSNGTIFSDTKIFEDLAQARPFCVNFSLHGPKFVHDALTGVVGSFDATTKALGYAVNAGIRTASNLVITCANSHPSLLKETVALLASVGVREMTLTRFIPCGLGKEASALSTTTDDFILGLETLLRETQIHGLSLLLANATPACHLPEHLRDLSNRCSFGFDKFYVDVHGNILTCGMSRLKIGNLLERPMRDVLRESSLYHKYLSDQHLPVKCQQCSDKALCGGGCRAAALSIGGSLNAEDTLSISYTH